MIIDTATTKFRVEKLAEEIQSMAEDFSESLENARKQEAPLAGLRMLQLMREVSDDIADLGEIMAVAMTTLPNNTDSLPTEVTLKGARALQALQSRKLMELAGLVTLTLQVAGAAASGQTKAEMVPSAAEEIR